MILTLNLFLKFLGHVRNDYFENQDAYGHDILGNRNTVENYQIPAAEAHKIN
jgi:hypothetical protein